MSGTSIIAQFFIYLKICHFVRNVVKPPFHQGLFCPESTRSIFLVDDQYFWLIGRISAKQSGTCGQSRTITWEGLERSGAIASVLRESGTEKVIGYCF